MNAHNGGFPARTGALANTIFATVASPPPPSQGRMLPMFTSSAFSAGLIFFTAMLALTGCATATAIASPAGLPTAAPGVRALPRVKDPMFVVHGTTENTTLPDTTFALDRADLTSTGRTSLAVVAAELSQYPAASVTCDGYTDGLGTPAHNLDLSRRRCASVITYLTTTLGVTNTVNPIAGHGERGAKDGLPDPARRFVRLTLVGVK